MRMAEIARAKGPTNIQKSRPKKAGADVRASVDTEKPPHRVARSAKLGRRAVGTQGRVGIAPKGKRGGNSGEARHQPPPLVKKRRMKRSCSECELWVWILSMEAS